MEPIADFTAARRAIRRYLTTAEASLPADTFARAEDLADSPSPVDAVVGLVELLYARRDQLDDDGRALVAQLASFAAVNGWHGMAENNRGGLVAQAMGRKKVADGDPEPKAEYLAKPAEPEK